MLFKICEQEPENYTKNTGYLIKDNWDDWFTYSTMFSFIFVDKNGIKHKLGSVKLGEVDMDKNNQRSPDLPLEFEKLSERFFSLGQSDYYYQRINKLGEDIRKKILTSLNDIAFNEEILQLAIKQHVTNISLLRDVSLNTVKGQFNRMANGGARLTEYNFIYNAPKDAQASSDPIKLEFVVVPESNPPTNVHVLIGRNGVGKTHLMQNMIKALICDNSREDTGSFNMGRNLFSKIVLVAFSAFDEFKPIEIKKDNAQKIPFIHIGLKKGKVEDEQNLISESNPLISKEINKELNKEFIKSLKVCVSPSKRRLWIDAINILESDPIFKEANIKNILSIRDQEKFEIYTNSLFNKLSSGHKIIILTITRLIENVEEKTLVFLDEPEVHLHPPLLSAFIRALSNLLISRNGVAIIATHSPVILQEVPKKCVWKLRRVGREAIAERLEIESFGENIGSLTSEVFGYEVTNSGFHNILSNLAEKYNDYKKIVSYFNDELGIEAKAILRSLIIKEEDE